MRQSLSVLPSTRTMWKLVVIVLPFLLSDVCTAKKPALRERHREKPKPTISPINVSNSLWKNEHENELTEAMMTLKRGNLTRVRSHTEPLAETEAVIDKLLESITASEKYMKKVDSIEFRLNRLDIEIHEKTNNILKYLSEMMKVIRSQGFSEKVDMAVDVLKSEMESIRLLMEKNRRSYKSKDDGRLLSSDNKIEGRLVVLDNSMKNLMVGVENILGVIGQNMGKNNQDGSQRLSTDNSGAIKSNGAVLGSESFAVVAEVKRALMEHRNNKRCDCTGSTRRSERMERYPSDCYEIQLQGFNVSGIYKIKPDDMDAFYVLCDLSTVGGGWTVLQNRFDGSQDFYKTWWDYKHGFGNLAGEFWLGLDKMYHLTNQKLYELRIEVETQRGQDAFAGYSVFTVGPEHEGYRISTLGMYYGNAGDSLTYHAGQKFSTPDVDNDEWKDGACAIEHGGAWWYKECDKSNLNGKYSMAADDIVRTQAVYWISFKGPNYPLTKTKIMIRPLPASRPIDHGERREMKPRLPSAEPSKALVEKRPARPKETADVRTYKYKTNPMGPQDAYYTYQ
ncbi:fibrinogen C domain-containing protein 1 [Plutella xylostella]|uniref:fibrinogen C domain-containing protein 1 n=1 Tax=Plutella xylostella TaxID=51655 RepID=UPI002032F524|nr:fibrinogen C domain-containing protein 1 [Plutella xylostella]